MNDLFTNWTLHCVSLLIDSCGFSGSLLNTGPDNTGVYCVCVCVMVCDQTDDLKQV